MSTIIYDKTDKGREEIATRKYQLAPRLRSLLVLIDGKQTVTDLLKKIVGLGLNEQNIQDLFDQNFIAESQSVNVPVAAALPAAIVEKDTGDVLEDAKTKATPKLAISDIPEENGRRIQAISKFFNETIKSTLGLRGFTLQMKVERASNMQDFEDLRHAYIEAVLKAKGKEMARSLRDRLDQLLYSESGVALDNNNSVNE
ncbi:MAG: hypothetical protein Q7T62_17350 [Undibacterium sp.]|nr:hypothetical protein [Undibacterium sp.]